MIADAISCLQIEVYYFTIDFLIPLSSCIIFHFDCPHWFHLHNGSIQPFLLPFVAIYSWFAKEWLHINVRLNHLWLFDKWFHLNKVVKGPNLTHMSIILHVPWTTCPTPLNQVFTVTLTALMQQNGANLVSYCDWLYVVIVQ